MGDELDAVVRDHGRDERAVDDEVGRWWFAHRGRAPRCECGRALREEPQVIHLEDVLLEGLRDVEAVERIVVLVRGETDQARDIGLLIQVDHRDLDAAADDGLAVLRFLFHSDGLLVQLEAIILTVVTHDDNVPVITFGVELHRRVAIETDDDFVASRRAKPGDRRVVFETEIGDLHSFDHPAAADLVETDRSELCRTEGLELDVDAELTEIRVQLLVIERCLAGDALDIRHVTASTIGDGDVGCSGLVLVSPYAHRGGRIGVWYPQSVGTEDIVHLLQGAGEATGTDAAAGLSH